MLDPTAPRRPPSRAVSLAIAAALVAIWGYLRLVAFPTSVFPLTYALPLLVCIWTRDRLALWGMAIAFVGFHTLKVYWLLPPGTLPPDELWTNYGTTLVNVGVGGTAVHLVIVLRERLEQALGHVGAQAEELRAQSEELAQQNEELAEQTEELSHQTEELTQQGEELASQNEELQSQTEEIAVLMDAVERRGALLQTLLDTARSSGSEHAALDQIAAAALDLFGDVGAVVAAYEQTPEGLRLRAAVPGGDHAAGAGDAAAAPRDDLVSLVLVEGRTASLDDAAARPDLALARFGNGPSAAALAAPIRLAGEVFGAFAVYSGRVHEWSEEEFRLAEWLADQCGRVLQTLRVQSELREADRRKSVFLATLSHELRNPLAAIRFALETLGGDGARDPNAIRVMRRQLRQLVRLVDDLLDATRLSSNKIQIRTQRVNLVPIVEHAVDAARPDVEAARHGLDVGLPRGAIWVDADPDRIAQVVTNLLSNATRYTPPGGRLAVRLAAEGNDAVLSVADSGVGLTQADLERVFDMFMQVGDPGSGGLGIGLALVRGIVELHGGSVEARSHGPGRGSEFRVSLPMVAAPAAAAAKREVATPEVTPRRVLVVDDNVDSATAIGALLSMHGHEVRVVHDAESALAELQRFAPEAALLDIGLPGVDGYELARRLRRDPATRRVRLVALTGWGQDADRARAEAAGFDAHLTKPAEPADVLAALQGDPVMDARSSDAE